MNEGSRHPIEDSRANPTHGLSQEGRTTNDDTSSPDEASQIEDHLDHHHHHEHEPSEIQHTDSHIGLALSTTLHCLLGCGLGEVVGMVIATAASFGDVASIAFAVILGFVFGFILGMRPLMKAGFTLGRALRTVLIVEGLSIAVMETAEVLVEVYTPGVMEAGLADGRFWLGMALALAAGFCAAFPVNYLLVLKGVRHQH